MIDWDKIWNIGVTLGQFTAWKNYRLGRAGYSPRGKSPYQQCYTVKWLAFWMSICDKMGHKFFLRSSFISSFKIMTWTAHNFSILFTLKKCRDVSQEILDHIAHVDLVLNFKFRRGLNEKESRNSKFNAYQEYILMTSSRTTKQLQDDHDQSHAEEVTIYSLSLFLISILACVWFS